MAQTTEPAIQPAVPPPPPYYPDAKSVPLQTEEPPRKKGKGRCAGEGYDDFDFLVGSWNVYNVLDDREGLFGKMDIEFINEGCALLQRWTANNDYSLVTIFYFEPHLGTWRHQAVMPGTGLTEMVGGSVDDEVVLTGTLRSHGLFRMTTYRMRQIYSPNPDGTISLQMQFSYDEGLNWAETSAQIYRPRTTDRP